MQESLRHKYTIFFWSSYWHKAKFIDRVDTRRRRMLKLTRRNLARGVFQGLLFGGLMTLAALIMDADTPVLGGFIALGCVSILLLRLDRSSLCVALGLTVALPILIA